MWVASMCLTPVEIVSVVGVQAEGLLWAPHVVSVVGVQAEGLLWAPHVPEPCGVWTQGWGGAVEEGVLPDHPDAQTQ